MAVAKGEMLDKLTILSRLQAVDVAERMKQRDVIDFSIDKKRASVLVPLILCKDRTLEVLLTVRAHHLRNDAGDVAFPGGKRDEEDESDTATALREAWEEIGLHQADVEVISQLPPMISRTGYFVTPITSFIPDDFRSNINPNEVDDVFRVSLIDFLRLDHHDSYTTPNTGRFARLHIFRHTIDGKEYTTYGLTAYICILTACAVYQRAPDFQMEPGFSHKDFTYGFLDLMERRKKKQRLLSSRNKL